MNTADFDYGLPKELIAQTPVPTRHASRMLVIHRTEDRIEHAMFSDLSHYLAKEDLVVLNDTRVIPARIVGTKIPSGGRVELLFLEESAPGEWEALIRSSRRLYGDSLDRCCLALFKKQCLGRKIDATPIAER